MVNIGELSTLKVVKILDFGAYLDSETYGEILLPTNYIPSGCKEGDEVEVFIYLDTEDRIIATTVTPKIKVGEFAYLKVVDRNAVGWFLDWGIPGKDLFLPFREQKDEMKVNRSYVVYAYVDELSDRIAASAKISKFLDKEDHNFKVGDVVDLFIFDSTDIGFKAIINETHEGILFKNEVYQRLRTGDKVKGYIKKLRPDGKIDLSLQKFGYGKVLDLTDKIIERLEEEGGFLNINDKSPSMIINNVFGSSKKSFKKAIGSLYKEKRILIEKEGIRLIEKDREA